MGFSSLVFIYLFLPLCLILYFSNKSMLWRNVILVVFSLLFYAWGRPVWVLLLALTAAWNYVMGLLMDKHKGGAKEKAAFLGGIIGSLLPLVIFKYTPMLVSTVNSIFGTAIAQPEMGLPIGISFYTFECITYMVDTYRGKAPVQRSYFKLLMFLSLFPQIMSGPIVRYESMAPQLENRKVTVGGLTRGITRFCIGLAKKVLLADTASQLVSTFLGSNTTYPVLGVWAGILSYTLQIYFDFSGYTDMAMGIAKMFGFDYPENFNYPYVSRSITDFWRRWHMSLSSFFRDYVYIPLGGNRTGHQMRNLLIVWALTGLWHGASWNFVLWGLYYFALLVVEKKFYREKMESLPRIVSALYSVFFVMIGWALFYFTDMSQGIVAIGAMFGIGAAGFTNMQTNLLLLNNLWFFLLAIVGCAPWAKYIRRFLRGKAAKSRGSRRIVLGVNAVFNLVLLGVSTAMLIGETFTPFLYFQF